MSAGPPAPRAPRVPAAARDAPPVLQRTPVSHKVIEKRRRDRINRCLAELGRTVPLALAKQVGAGGGAGREDTGRDGTDGARRGAGLTARRGALRRVAGLGQAGEGGDPGDDGAVPAGAALGRLPPRQGEG